MTSDLTRADHLLDLGRHRQAEEIVRAHLVGDPGSADALRLLTLALLGQDRSAEAVQTAEAAVRSAPTEEHGHRLLSIAYVRVDRPRDALRAAEEAVRAAPGMWQTHYTLGMALRAQPMPRPRDALACANEAVRLAPHESSPHNLAGLCLDDLRMPAEARRAYEEALRLDPQSTSAMNNLAATSAQEGRLSAAGRMLSAGLSADPQEAMLHQNYDRLLFAIVLRLSLALAGLAVLLAILAGQGAPYAVRVVTTVVLGAVFAAATLRVVRSLPRGSHLWVRGLLRRSTWPERLVLGCFLLLTAAVLVMGVAPREVTLVTGVGILRMTQALGIAFFAMWILSPLAGWVRRQTARDR